MCLFRKKCDKVVFVAIINGEMKMFDSKKSMFDYCEKYNSDNYISSLGMFKCEMFNFLKN